MSGKVGGLLKYRFTKRESEKLVVSQNASGDSQGSAATGGGGTPSKQQNGLTLTVPDTPEPRRPSVPSPVFGATTTPKRLQISPGSSSGKSSPWLSKATGMATSTALLKGSTSLGNSQSSSYSITSSSSSSKSLDDREMLRHLADLENMFPGKSKQILMEALKTTQDLDAAVDYIIDDNKFTEARNAKRVRQPSSLASPDSSPLQPLSKKARQLSYGDTPDADTNSQATTSKTPEKRTPHQQFNYTVLSEKMDFLAEAFPKMERPALFDVLKKEEYNLDKATSRVTALLEKQVSRTENVGSIKAFKEARAASSIITFQNKGDGGGGDGEIVIDITQEGNTEPEVDADQGSEDWDRDDANSDVVIKEDEEVEEEEEEEEDDKEDHVQIEILSFLNEASEQELAAMSGCSKKKADNVVKLRPFDDWEDMVGKFEHCRVLSSFAVITEVKELLRLRGMVEKLMKRCEQLSYEIEAAVSGLTGKVAMDEVDADYSYITHQPRNINPKMQLTPYQLVGLNWLNVMHEQALDGILGDEMGLGKTIQTIAFMAHMLETGELGPHIIIAPSSTLDNWLQELKLWCPDLKVLLYYGSQEERAIIRCQVFDGSYDPFHVAVTTYAMATGSTEDRAMLKKFKFHYAIFDEGHMLKNMSSLRYKSLAKIKAKRRLLLTGTPLQNNLLELMSLLAFVMPDLFTGKTDQLKKIFTTISGKASDDKRSSYEMETIVQTKNILKPFFLRRLKTEVLQQLPKKTERMERVSMGCEQQELYDDLKKEFANTIRQNSEKGVAGKSGMAMVMSLRKAANHHLLLRKNFDNSTLRRMAKIIVKEPSHPNAVEQYVYEDLEVMSDFELHKFCLQYKRLKSFRLQTDDIVDSGKFRYLDRVLPEMKAKGDKVLLFSQFTMVLDIVEEYMSARSHTYLRLDGSTPVVERQEMIDQFNNSEEIFIFLLSTRAGGLGINLRAANMVIVHDMDYNPYNDKQAEDRCHRLGQTREVQVYKLVSSDTIEEAIWRCAQAKLKLEQDVTNSKKGDDLNSADVGAMLKEALGIDVKNS